MGPQESSTWLNWAKKRNSGCSSSSNAASLSSDGASSPQCSTWVLSEEQIQECLSPQSWVYFGVEDHRFAKHFFDIIMWPSRPPYSTVWQLWTLRKVKLSIWTGLIMWNVSGLLLLRKGHSISLLFNVVISPVKVVCSRLSTTTKNVMTHLKWQFNSKISNDDWIDMLYSGNKNKN